MKKIRRLPQFIYGSFMSIIHIYISRIQNKMQTGQEPKKKEGNNKSNSESYCVVNDL